MWRRATPADDDAIVEMNLALNREDPGPRPVPAEHTRSTLSELAARPERGCAVVLELDGKPSGYALLMWFWSNEIGGEVCVIDELFVVPGLRGHGHASRLLESLARETTLRPEGLVALALETTPDNERARRLYERLGFRGRNIGLRRLL